MVLLPYLGIRNRNNLTSIKDHTFANSDNTRKGEMKWEVTSLIKTSTKKFTSDKHNSNKIVPEKVGQKDSVLAEGATSKAENG